MEKKYTSHKMFYFTDMTGESADAFELYCSHNNYRRGDLASVYTTDHVWIKDYPHYKPILDWLLANGAEQDEFVIIRFDVKRS